MDYEGFKKGLFSIPYMPEGSYLISYRGGFRGIVLDAEVSNEDIADLPKYFRRIAYANPDRLYLGMPFKVAPWMEKAWSICTAPSEEERVGFRAAMPETIAHYFEHARLDAICRIDIEGETVVRGLLYSAPRL